ncbi:MAG: DUF2007 domain-containing protein [Anaerolineaceae bacterium]|nr:DUF2007 domain-containing protein [Anaerolineaceae bacterium]
MGATNNQKVTSVNGMLQAMIVQNALEKAGIPVTIANAKGEAYLDVLVPNEWVYDAQNLLSPERRCGEIYFVPGYDITGSN